LTWHHTRQKKTMPMSLANRIIEIVNDGPKKKMRWIHATRIIALVTHLQTMSDIAERKQPRNTMSIHLATLKQESPVTLFIAFRLPHPTISQPGHF
jgi:uncharacterized membrane protein